MNKTVREEEHRKELRKWAELCEKYSELVLRLRKSESEKLMEINALKKENARLKSKIENYESMSPEEMSISQAARILQSGWRRRMKEKRLSRTKEEVKQLENELGREEVVQNRLQ